MNPVEVANKGMNLLRQGHVQQAAAVAGQLLQDASDSAPVHYFACEVALAKRDTHGALQHISQAVELESEEPALLFRKAQVEALLRQGLQAQKTAREAAELNSKDLPAQMEAARIFSESGNHQGAEAFLKTALDVEPNNPHALFELVKVQFYQGKMQAAEQTIARFLELDVSTKGPLLLLRARLQKQTPDNNHVDALRVYLSHEHADNDAANAYFALAKELEDLGEYPQSFEALKTGAELQRKLLKVELDTELSNMHDITSTFQADAFASMADSDSTASPIFIVGMPRTGTTLVEHILSRHQGVQSAGESNDFTFAMTSVIDEHLAAHPEAGLNPLSAALQADTSEMACRYMRSVKGMLGPADRYVNKLPVNFLYCGLIKKAFPNAKIIHLVRNPMDTCYAVFKTLFNQSYYFSYDLDELADYYAAYRHMMDHWHALMPGAILDVQYEQLVSDPHKVSRQIIDYCDLTWSEDLIDVNTRARPSSTASAAQIREPIYTSSVEKWRNFETELAPLAEKLGAAGLLN